MFYLTIWLFFFIHPTSFVHVVADETDKKWTRGGELQNEGGYRNGAKLYQYQYQYQYQVEQVNHTEIDTPQDWWMGYKFCDKFKYRLFITFK